MNLYLTSIERSADGNHEISINDKKISKHPEIPATTHLGLPNLCINNSRSLANIYTIDRYDIKPAVMKR